MYNWVAMQGKELAPYLRSASVYDLPKGNFPLISFPLLKNEIKQGKYEAPQVCV